MKSLAAMGVVFTLAISPVFGLNVFTQIETLSGLNIPLWFRGVIIFTSLYICYHYAVKECSVCTVMADDLGTETLSKLERIPSDITNADEITVEKINQISKTYRHKLSLSHTPKLGFLALWVSYIK